MFITSPEVFADLFNTKIPDAYRKVTSNDVRLMTECHLIGKYNFYIMDDLETVRGILEYEQLREKRPAQSTIENSHEPPKCKMCGELLHLQPSGKKGRLKEYCQQCQSARVTERYRRWRKKRKEVKIEYYLVSPTWSRSWCDS